MSLDERKILSYIGAELEQASGGNGDSIEANRQAALAAYLGQPDGKEVKGRSSVVSTDVADAIEWIMPEIVKAFTQNNEVVTFDATFEGDEDQAAMESQYVYDILMKENKGFLVLHQFIKDALMQKNGFIKVFYSDDVKETTESYTGLTEMEFNVTISDPELELIEQSVYEESGIPLFDIKVRRTVDNSKINVVAVPPEEFRVARGHNSVDLSDCRFSAHVMLKTAGDLVAEGYTREFVDSLPTSDAASSSEYRFYMQDENVAGSGGDSLDPSLRLIEVAECYMHLDLDEDGVAELVKVEVAGGDSPSVIIDIEEIDENPFISTTAILMSHKLHGLSIYDRLKQIQEQKTTLWRNIFDNMYLQNNQRTVVVESQVNLDDLMLSRPGGIIRAQRLDAVKPYVTPPLSSDAYQMMDYLDQVGSGRSGVSPDSPISDSMIGDRVGSEGIERMMGQKEELVGLMIRVIAETGIKPLCYMIRNQAIRHQDTVREYKFRDQWVQINPKNWRKRTNSTVRVGTGSGNRKEQIAAINTIMMIQKEMLAQPGQVLVKADELFNAVDDFAKFAGMRGASRYFIDPKSERGKEIRQQTDQQQSQMQKLQMQLEQSNADATRKLSEAEMQKAKAAQENVYLKAQNEQQKAELSVYKLESETQQSALKQRLEEAEAMASAAQQDANLEFKYWDARERHAIERARIAKEKESKSDNKGDQDV